MGIVNKNFKSSHRTEIISLKDDQITRHLFKIPPYQRNYSWGDEQIEDIRDSISTLLQNPHDEDLIYLGTIIVLKKENDGSIYEILDGQQRLTTMFLYIRALIALYNKITNNIDYTTWENHSIRKEFQDKFNQLNLDKIIYNQGSSFGLGATANNSPRIIYKNEKENHKYIFNPSSPINKKNLFQTNYHIIYNDIYEQYQKEKERNLQDSLIFILKLGSILAEKIVFDFTITSNSADAFSIFESLNTTGLLLSPSDIVSGAINNGKHPSALTKEYNKMVDNLTLEKFDITNLLHYYVQIKKGDTSINKSEIVTYFKNITKEQIEELIIYFTLVQEFKNDNEVLFALINSYFSRKQLWPTIYGLLLYNYAHNIDESKTIDFITFILMFSILELNILKHSPGGIFKRILNKYTAELSKNGLQNLPSNYIMDELKEYLKTISYDENNIKDSLLSFDEKCKKGIFVLYFYLHNTSANIDLSKINLEHIFPKSPDSDWFKNGWPEEEEEKNNLVNSFGNMIILNEKINKKISNSYITTKKNLYDKHRDEALQSSQINTVDFERFETEKGNYIKDRSNSIVNIILEIKILKDMISLIKK